MENKSLNDVVGNVGPINEQVSQSFQSQSEDTTNAHSTYIKIFSRLLAQRFDPYTTELSNIPVQSIQKLSYFAYGAAKIASQVWTECNQEMQQQSRRQRLVPRGQKVA